MGCPLVPDSLLGTMMIPQSILPLLYPSINFRKLLWDPNNVASDRLTRLGGQLEPNRNMSTPLYGKQSIQINQIINDTLLRQERIEELGNLYGAFGEATKTFYKALPKKPKDPLVMSIALHILLNSLTFSGLSIVSEEEKIRLYKPWGPR